MLARGVGLLTGTTCRELWAHHRRPTFRTVPKTDSGNVSTEVAVMRNHWLRWVVTGAVLVAIASGGYIVLGASGGSAKTAARTSDPRIGAASIAPTPAVASGVPDAVAAGAGGSGASSSGSSVSGSYACPMIPADPGAASTGGVTSSGGAASSSGGVGAEVGSATHLFTRTTADGITIRAYRSVDVDPCPVSPCGMGVAPITVELSNASAVGQGSLFDDSTGTSATTKPLSASSGAFGVVEGTPVWWVAVSVATEVSTVQMTFADGSSDQMTPVGGVAVVARGIDASAASSGNGPYDVTGTLRLLDASGAVLDTVTFPQVVPTPIPVPEPGPITNPVVTPANPSTTSTTVASLVSPPASPPASSTGASTSANTSTATIACENDDSPPSPAAN